MLGGIDCVGPISTGAPGRFENHYTKLEELIVGIREYSVAGRILIRNLHQYRSAYGGLRRLIKRTLERSGT